MTQDSQQARPRAFNPNDHVMQLKSKQGAQDYLPVQWRLVWFRADHPQGTIETEIVHLDLDKETEEETYAWSNETRRSEKVIKTAKGMAIFRATVRDGKGGIATGTKMEKAASFPDWLEKAETGAIGRALAALGYGTQFAGEELNESHRIVDSPVGRAVPDAAPQQASVPVHVKPAPMPAPKQQASSNVTPTPAVQTPAVIAMIARAKGSVEALDMAWEDVKRDALNANVPDTTLTVPQVAQVNSVIAQYKEKRNAA